MYNDNEQQEVILTPLSDVLDTSLYAGAFLTGKIEEYLLKEYFFQSVFMKMCGAQEQKLKCILWEIATHDYELRHDYMRNGREFGECSTLSSKMSVCRKLHSACKKINGKEVSLEALFWITHDKNEGNNKIQKWESSFEKAFKRKYQKYLANNTDATDEELMRVSIRYKQEAYSASKYQEKRKCALREKLLNNAYNSMKTFMEAEFVVAGSEHDLCDFFSYKKSLFDNESFSPSEGYFFKGNTIPELYQKVVYNHRNQCAHNLNSAVKNLPTFVSLKDSDNIYCNYFFRYYFLLLVDEVIRTIYLHYLDLRYSY